MKWCPNGEVIRIDSPADLPERGTIAEVREPWRKIEDFYPNGVLPGRDGLW